MVPKLFRAGQSFRKLGAYLLHDPEKAKTNARVRWTHTLNLADDHPARAIDEMLWTYRAAEELKREAGVPGGGRPLKHPVRHFSLNWHPSESPSREQMVEAVESFLAHMKWQEHQALIVCHDDKHPHVHVMLNAVHPETGRALDATFDQWRAQEWAKQYEREHGLIFCEARMKPYSERTASPTREAWEQLRSYEKDDNQREHERTARLLDDLGWDDANKENAAEWKALKERQKEERLAHFAEGKEAFREARNAAYREVRTEFREAWSCYYDAKRRGLDTESLAEMKTDIIARQRAELDTRREAACNELRQYRDWDYEQIKRRHREQREALTERQERGESSPELTAEKNEAERSPDYAGFARDLPLEERPERGVTEHFRMAARDTTSDVADPRETAEQVREEPFASAPHDKHKVRDPVDAAGGLGMGALGALAAMGERLFDGFLAGGNATKPVPREKIDAPRDRGGEQKEAAIRAVTLQAKNEAREAEEKAAKQYWEDRKKRRRERD